MTARTLAASMVFGAARVGLGLLWLHEGCTETMEAQSLLRANATARP